MSEKREKFILSRRDFIKASTIGIGGGVILASCSPAATPEATEAMRWTARIALEQAAVPGFDELPPVWAQRSGFFAEHGVDLQITETGGGAAVAVEPFQLLLGEQIDFADVLFPAGFEVILDGAPLKGLGTFHSGGRYGYWMVTKKEIQDWPDLIGKKYVISSPGGPPDGIGRYAMAKYGVPVDQVEFVPLGGSSARKQALLAGEVDAALVHPLDALELVGDNPDVHVMSNLAEAPLLFGVDVTFQTALETNRDMVVAYVKASILAVRAFLDDRDLAVNAYLEIVPETDKAYLEEVWQDYVTRGVWEPNGGLNRELYDATMDAYVEIGALPAKVEWDDFMDASVVEEVLADIGTR
jgi:ABC-type nitrate/sulfonate/bicarbonate transport system substrate-binding protein